MKAQEITGLDCGGSAADGIRLVLSTRLNEMCSFRAPALVYDDPAGVHDMRVASRRLRSLLRDFSPYFRRSRKLRQAKDDLKRIASALGFVRDQDVAILALEKLADDAPPELAAGIKAFADTRRLRLERARIELEQALTEDAINKLRGEFDAALERDLKGARSREEKGEGQKAAEAVSFKGAGVELITAGIEELRGLSASLYRPFKTKPLHHMRLAAKRLRYGLELYAPCWSEPLRPFAKEIAKLQTSLGELHDCDLWIAEIGEALQGNERAETDEAQNVMIGAAVWLLDYFVKARSEYFRAALARWHEWETSGFLARLKETL